MTTYMSARLLADMGELCWPVRDLHSSANEPAKALLQQLAAALGDRFWERDWFKKATELPKNDGTRKDYLQGESREQPLEPFERMAFFFRFYRCAYTHAMRDRPALGSIVPEEVVLLLKSGVIHTAVHKLAAQKPLAGGQGGARSAA